MKNSRWQMAAVMGLAGLAGWVLVGCAAVGSNPTGPTKFESLFYNTVTNYVTVTRTNEVAVPVWSTNQVTLTVTNQQNQVITTVSNVVNETWHTNQVVAPAQVPQYTDTLKPSVASGISIGGAILNTFFPGVGSMAATGLVALLGAGAWFRSSKQGTNTGTALVQEIETAREFIKALPNGEAYDTAFVNWLQAHQNEAGVATQVVKLVESKLSNPDAKVAAQGMIDIINALKATTTTIAPVSAATS